MKKLQILRALSAVALTGLILAGCSANSSEPLVMVGVPVDDSQNVAESYQLMMDVVSDSVDREVEFYESQDYASGTQALIGGRVDIAVLSVFSYVLATSASEDIKLLATVARDGGALPGAYAYGIRRSGDAAVTDLEDLRGKKVCFSDPSSGVGFFWPAYSMFQLGIDPDPVNSADYEAVFAGTFPQVAIAVSNGDCDAGFLLDAMYDTVIPRSEAVDMDTIEQFWTSPVLPGLALVYNASSVTEQEAEQIKAAMLAKGNKTALVEDGVCAEFSGCRFLSAAAWGFVDSEDSFYDPLRELCTRMEIAQCSN